MNKAVNHPLNQPAATYGRLDPRTVIILFVALSVWISYTHRTSSLAVAAITGLLCVSLPGGFREGRNRLWALIRWSLPFALIIVVLYVLLATDEGLIITEFGPVAITQTGVETGVRLAVRFIAFVAAARALMLYATPSGLAAGMTRFLSPLRYVGLKPELLYHFVFVTLRLVPGLATESQTIRLAQRSRGWRPGRGLTGRVRSARAIVIPTFAAAMRRADTLSVVLSSRGVALTGTPYPVASLRFRAIDVVLISLVCLALVIGIALPRI